MRVRLQFDDQALKPFYEFFYIWKKLVFFNPVLTIPILQFAKYPNLIIEKKLFYPSAL